MSEVLHAARRASPAVTGPLVVELHVLDVDAVPELAPRTLTIDELERAHRFHHDHDRRRYIARRAWLRERLSAYVGLPPERLRFETNAFGRPGLAGGSICFNFSHSRGLALLAVADGRPVGCDVEWRDSSFPYADVGARFFTPREAAHASQLSPEAALDAFFLRWTCKEAFVKACGCGLSRPLDTFEIEVLPGQARLGAGCAGWSVQSLSPAPGYQAAVVAPGPDWILKHIG